jgi:hypothetical protein
MVKKTKAYICACIVFYLSLLYPLCACSPHNPEQTSLNELPGDYLSLTNQMEPAAERDVSYLRIYLPASADKKQQELANQLATAAAQAAGFKLIFDISAIKDYSDGSPSSTMEDALYKSEAGVHIIYKRLLYNNMHLFGDFYEQAETWAPNYFKKSEGLNAPGTLYIMPMSFGKFSNQPAVFIRDDVYMDYGREIRNGDELEALLKHLARAYPPSVPCLAWQSVNPGTAFDLFLPGNGYISLQNIFSAWSGIETMLWMDESDGSIRAFYDIPASYEAIRRYWSWLENGLMEEAVFNADPAKYPVILTVSNDFRNAVNGSGWADTLLKAIPGYTLNVFNSQERYLSTTNYAAVAKPGTGDISEFLRFMEWLEADAANYRYFMDELYQPLGSLVAHYFRKQEYEDYPYEDLQITGYPKEFFIPETMLSAEMSKYIDSGFILAQDAEYYDAYQTGMYILRTLANNMDRPGVIADSDKFNLIDAVFSSISKLENIDLAERLLMVK